MGYIIFYILGYFISFVILYLENKTRHTGNKFSEALLVCLLSWVMVLLYVVFVIETYWPNITNTIDRKNKWFEG